jgi:hypothetical protein
MAIYYAVAIGYYDYCNKEKTRISSNLVFMNYILYSVDISENNPANRAAYLRGREDHNKIANILLTGEDLFRWEGENNERGTTRICDKAD